MKYFLFFLCFFLCSCRTVDFGQGRTREISERISQMTALKAEEIRKANQDIIKKKDQEIESIKNNHIATSDWIFGTRIALDLFEPKGRLWDITSNRLNTAASYAPPPSREALIEQVKTLKEELDESKVSNEDLNARYNKAREDAAIAIQVQEQKKVEADNAVRKLTEIELEHEKRISEVKSELIDAQKLIQANSDEKKAQDEWRRKQIRWIMSVTGILSVAALAGAIFVPIMKKELGVLAGVLGAITILLPFVTPFYAAIALGTAFFGSLGVITYKFVISDRTNKAVIRAVQEHKEEDPEGFKLGLAPKLENWTGKYDKDGKVVEDKTITSYIDKVLIETEAK